MTTTDIQADFQTYSGSRSIDDLNNATFTATVKNYTRIVFKTPTLWCMSTKKNIFRSCFIMCDLFLLSHKLYIVWNEHIGFAFPHYEMLIGL